MDGFQKTERPDPYIGPGLRRIIFALSSVWEKQEAAFGSRLVSEGFKVYCSKEMQTGSVFSYARKTGSLVLTDNTDLAGRLKEENLPFFGCRMKEDSWFLHAALVLESLDGLDGRFLEEWYCRMQGQPVLIAATRRLRLREMTAEDADALAQIGLQETVQSQLRCKDCLSRGYLQAYRKHAYRLQGFGLWSVLLQERVIGCCGFSPWETDVQRERSCGNRVLVRCFGKEQPEKTLTDVPAKNREAPCGGAAEQDCFLQEAGDRGRIPEAEQGCRLELQYFLDEAYRGRGYGREMCLAALAYAKERLEAEAVYLVIRPDNIASAALAAGLGFSDTA